MLSLRSHSGPGAQIPVGKQTKRNESSRRHAVAAGEAGMDHPKIVKTDVCELRTTCDFAYRPNGRRRGLQPLIHFDISSSRSFDTS